MKKRDIAFAVLAVALAAVFVSFGLWQLRRLAERREFNEQLRSRAETAPVDFSALPSDTGARHYRRVRIAGTYDFANELVITNRTRQGSPGVHIITPLRIPGRDTAVLVNRGWIYAPDGMTVDLSKWREPQSMTGDAFIENFRTGNGVAATSRNRRAFRWMDQAAVSKAVPYPIATSYAVLIGTGATRPDVPPRLSVPPLDEGPHKSYALQWFSFASISIIGMFLFLRRR